MEGLKMNELMAEFGDAGYVYFRTAATDCGAARDMLVSAMKGAGINTDNLNFSRCTLRDSGGEDIGTLDGEELKF